MSPDELVLEGIVITLDSAGHANIAPMGPRVDRAITRLVLRPYSTSHTYQNLKATGRGVFHITDDVELLARAAVGQLQPPPSLTPINGFLCPRLADVCRWFAFDVKSFDDSAERIVIDCAITARGEVRPFFEQIRRDVERLATVVQKTAGLQERRAFDFLQTYIAAQLAASEP
ncbi:MAG: DUF447 family protein [Planctomycetia bacterium]|nr:DUF447 family protein [Planctomycetia bacterium]